MTETIENSVRLFRTNIGATQMQVGREIHVSRQTINRIESKSQVPSLLIALRLAKLFGCLVEDIFGENRAIKLHEKRGIND